MKIQFNQKLDSFLLLLGVYCLLTYFNVYAMEVSVHDTFKKVCNTIEIEREKMYKEEGWSIINHYKDFLKKQKSDVSNAWDQVKNQSNITTVLLDTMMRHLRSENNYCKMQEFIAYLSENHYNKVTADAHEALVDFLKKAFYWCYLTDYINGLSTEKITQFPQDAEKMYDAIIIYGQWATCFFGDTYREVFYREISIAYGYMLGCASSSSEKVDTKKIEDELAAKDKNLAKIQEDLINSQKRFNELGERLKKAEANQNKSKNELPIYLYGATALSTVGFLITLVLYLRK